MANQYTKAKLVSIKNQKEIFYNIINSLLAGSLVFLGSLTNGFSWNGVGIGIIASTIVAITRFQKYWTTQEKEYCKGLFNFFG
jgi:hypothetical protein